MSRQIYLVHSLGLSEKMNQFKAFQHLLDIKPFLPCALPQELKEMVQSYFQDILEFESELMVFYSRDLRPGLERERFMKMLLAKTEPPAFNKWIMAVSQVANGPSELWFMLDKKYWGCQRPACYYRSCHCGRPLIIH